MAEEHASATVPDRAGNVRVRGVELAISEGRLTSRWSRRRGAGACAPRLSAAVSRISRINDVLGPMAQGRHDLDPTRRTAKWREAEKLADFIADGLRARLARGSGFIGRGSVDG